jgi:hypothetical protein
MAQAAVHAEPNDASSKVLSRTGGILYLYIIAAALFGEMYVRDRLIVRGDAAATASNILGSETLFRVSIAGELITCLCDVALAAILYLLFRPVNRSVSLLAAANRLTFAGVYCVSKYFLVAALVLLDGGDYLKALDPDEVNALAYASLRLHGFGYGISLAFFGVHCGLLGWLVYRSDFAPRVIGVLLVIGGVGYVVHSTTQTLSPEVAGNLFPWVILPAFPAELGLTLWLLMRRVDRRPTTRSSLTA